MEGVRRYDSQLCYFKWIGMLLYLSFNTPFENVYNALGVLGLVVYEGQLIMEYQRQRTGTLRGWFSV